LRSSIPERSEGFRSEDDIITEAGWAHHEMPIPD
jgi:hypothetical protein